MPTTYIAFPEAIKNKLQAEQALTHQEQSAVRRVDAFNTVRDIVPLLARADLKFGWIRVLSLVILSAVTIGSTASLLIAVFQSKDLAAVISSGAVVIVSLAYAGFTNPLQTVERDEVYRRWSDMIVSTYLIQIADEEAGPVQVEAAARRASARFAVMAGSYAALVAKNADTMAGFATAAVAAAAKKDDEPEEPTQIAVTNPGNQSSKSAVALEPELTIDATGPGTLSYEFTGLPAGLAGAADTGKVTGTPTTKSSSAVTVKVSSSQADVGTATISFSWNVTA